MQEYWDEQKKEEVEKEEKIKLVFLKAKYEKVSSEKI